MVTLPCISYLLNRARPNISVLTTSRLRNLLHCCKNPDIKTMATTDYYRDTTYTYPIVTSLSPTTNVPQVGSMPINIASGANLILPIFYLIEKAFKVRATLNGSRMRRLLMGVLNIWSWFLSVILQGSPSLLRFIQEHFLSTENKLTSNGRKFYY